MKTIVTLCDRCAVEYADDFSVKPISGTTTTPKIAICERCRTKFGDYMLRQYLIGRKGK